MSLTQNIVHYTKLSASWQGVQERVKVNHSIVTTTSPGIKHYTWRFTNRRAELWNSVVGSWDESWEGWQQALDFWSAARQAHGYDVKLWIAKPTETQKKFVRGTKLQLERLGQAVSILTYVPKKDLLTQWFRIEDWEETVNYAPVDNKLYPRQWTWQNPTSSAIKGAKKGDW